MAAYREGINSFLDSVESGIKNFVSRVNERERLKKGSKFSAVKERNDVAAAKKLLGVAEIDVGDMPSGSAALRANSSTQDMTVPPRPSRGSELNSDMSAVMAQRDLAAAEKLFGKQDLGGEPMPSGSAALRANSSTQPTPTMAQSESAAGFEGIQRAKAVAPTDDKMLMGVFKTTMGSDFDPNSKADKRKLDELRSFMASKPDLQGMSANKIALAFYRRK